MNLLWPVLRGGRNRGGGAKYEYRAGPSQFRRSGFSPELPGPTQNIQGPFSSWWRLFSSSFFPAATPFAQSPTVFFEKPQRKEGPASKFRRFVGDLWVV